MSTDTRAALERELRDNADWLALGARQGMELSHREVADLAEVLTQAADFLARSAPKERGEGEIMDKLFRAAWDSEGGGKDGRPFEDASPYERAYMASGVVRAYNLFERAGLLASPPAPVEGTREPASFGARLQEARLASGWSLRELAATLGITPERLAAAERDEGAHGLAVSPDSGVSASLLASHPVQGAGGGYSSRPCCLEAAGVAYARGFADALDVVERDRLASAPSEEGAGGGEREGLNARARYSMIFDRLERYTPEQRAEVFYHAEARWCWDCGREQTECSGHPASPAPSAPEEERRCLTCGASLAVIARRFRVSLDPAAIYCGPECDPREREEEP